MDELIDDIKEICSIDEQTLNKIIYIYKDTKAEQLERAVELRKLAQNNDNKKGIKSFSRVMSFITDAALDERDFNKALDELQDTIFKISLGDNEVESGWEKIRNSINQLEDYFIEKKIEEIKNRYSRVDTFQIVTDVRPIFNMQKNNISTSIYPYILKIDTIDGNSITCEFYDDEIDSIISELELAKKKSISLKEKYG